MKKLLCLITILAMIPFCNVKAQKSDKNVSEAVDILCDLGMVENADLSLESYISRGEFVRLAVKSLGYEKEAEEGKKHDSVFNDVSTEHRENGYINVMQSLQVVRGFGDGTFRPDTEITYGQAVKILVVTLGYEDFAREKGGWPEGYIKIAEDEKITSGICCSIDEPLKTESALMLLYRFMNTRMIDSICHYSWDEPYKTNETVFTRYWELDRWEGTLVKGESGEIILCDAICTEYGSSVIKNELSLNLKTPLNEIKADGSKAVVYVSSDVDYEKQNPDIYALHILN